LQELFAGLPTKDCDGESLFDGLQQITQSIIYDIQAASDSVEFHPELKQYETSLLEKALASRKRMKKELASGQVEEPEPTVEVSQAMCAELLKLLKLSKESKEKEAHNHDE